MGSIANPITSGAMNPTGNQLALDSVLGTSPAGANPLFPNISTSPNATATNSNPYSVSASTPATGATTPATTPAFPANSSPYATTGTTAIGGTPAPGSTGTGINSTFGNMSPQQWQQLFGTLKKTYGFGGAEALISFLEGGAGYSQEALNSVLASLQPGIQSGEENLMSQFSASGNRFGSGSQLGLADYLSQVNLNEGQISSQMYEQAVSNYMNTLLNVEDTNAKRIASSPSTLDSVLQGLNLGGTAVAGVSQGISAINPSADTGILDSIAGAAAGL